MHRHQLRLSVATVTQLVHPSSPCTAQHRLLSGVTMQGFGGAGTPSCRHHDKSPPVPCQVELQVGFTMPAGSMRIADCLQQAMALQPQQIVQPCPSHGRVQQQCDPHTMRSGSTTKVLAKCMLKYYRTSKCHRASQDLPVKVGGRQTLHSLQPARRRRCPCLCQCGALARPSPLSQEELQEPAGPGDC